jgi:hypothetical protein
MAGYLYSAFAAIFKLRLDEICKQRVRVAERLCSKSRRRVPSVALEAEFAAPI